MPSCRLVALADGMAEASLEFAASPAQQAPTVWCFGAAFVSHHLNTWAGWKMCNFVRPPDGVMKSLTCEPRTTRLIRACCIIKPDIRF
jgi:hypothetical protein